MSENTQNISVIGAGSWGSAVAQLLGHNGHKVHLWAREAEVVEGVNQKHHNPLFHPEYELSKNITAMADLKKALVSSEYIVVGIPTQFIRKALTPFKDQLIDKTIVVISKGIENATLMTVSQLLVDMQPKLDVAYTATLSGPSFSKEVFEQKPTAITIGCIDEKRVANLQGIFHCSYFRTYGVSDQLGVELGGALKNVIAIGVGIVEGMGFGLNTRAALITRALAEMSRLAKAMGAHPRTLSGLSGMGDLILTCTGDLSRNRSLGLKLGEGKSFSELSSGSKMVVEGVATAKSAYNLAKKFKVEMPIVEKVYQTLHEAKPAKQAIEELLARVPKAEFY